ncbi:MAG: hypothetical protein J1E65_09965 [Lachnospiraceae bacterium]|nr:hypothetical protein [Lachnospiraceae bacterium]
MNEQNKKLERIKKSSNVAMILARIAKIVCIVGAAICIVWGVGLIAFHDKVNAELQRAEAEGSVDLNELIMELNVGGFTMSYSDSDRFSETLGVYMLLACVVMTIFAVLLHFTGRVFKKIKKSDSPFQKSILKDMIVVFALITLLALQSSILIGVMVGFSLWCIYSVFDYGCELQQLSDETL